MKKITLLFCLLITSLGFSQVVLEDFEGDAPPIRVENAAAEPNEDGTLAAIVADPVDVNGNVLEFITDSVGVPWQQAELTLQDDMLDLSTANKTVFVEWYSVAPFDALIRASAPSCITSAHSNLANLFSATQGNQALSNQPYVCRDCFILRFLSRRLASLA